MKTLIIVAIASAALALGACSKTDTSKLKADVQQTATDAKVAAHNVTDDPNLHQAADEAKAAGTKAKEGLIKAGDALKDATQDASASVKDAADHTKAAADDHRVAKDDDARK
jgi:hypothetical protein